MSEHSNLSQTWKTPDEILKLHRLRKKKQALSSRFTNKSGINKEQTEDAILEAVVAQKRKNPFAKHSVEHKDKIRKLTNISNDILLSEDTVFELINSEDSSEVLEDKIKETKGKLKHKPFDIKAFSNLFNESTEVEIEETEKTGEKLPIDWSLKLRMRILCETILPGGNLKANQEASGITGFVRCADRKNDSQNSSLDISLGARFHQGLHYWQHPTLPWFTLFPRNAKDNSGFQINEKEREWLEKDWSESFRGVFQLLRARQCPFFYLCANSYTVLFRSAGIGGRTEMHAIMSPTTRGMRKALREEEIEFFMPFKKENLTIKLNIVHDKNDEKLSQKIKEDTNNIANEQNTNEDTDEEDMEEEKWLESLGVEENEIRKISYKNVKQQFSQELADDFSDNSAVLVEGIECSAFFNFLLKAKSSITSVGRLAGVPPTLLSPVAFPKASMQSLTVRPSKVRNDGKEYFSAELKGIILPNVLPYMTFLLSETKDAFSVTSAGHANTLAFTKVSKKLIEDSKDISDSDQVFGKGNLSDCGLQDEIVDLMCDIRKDSVSLIDRICFSKGEGFIWS